MEIDAILAASSGRPLPRGTLPVDMTSPEVPRLSTADEALLKKLYRNFTRTGVLDKEQAVEEDRFLADIDELVLAAGAAARTENVSNPEFYDAAAEDYVKETAAQREELSNSFASDVDYYDEDV